MVVHRPEPNLHSLRLTLTLGRHNELEITDRLRESLQGMELQTDLTQRFLVDLMVLYILY